MNTCENFIEQLKDELSEKYLRGRKLSLCWDSKGSGEGFRLQYLGGLITLDAKSPRAAIYGLSLLKVALKSGHLAEFCKEHSPQMALRPLWIKESQYSAVETCQRLLLLGYNAVVISQLSDEMLQVFRAYDIEVIFKGVSVPFLFEGNPDEIDQLSSVDYVFWESTIYSPEVSQNCKARDLLRLDLAKMEIEQLESWLNGRAKLIYYIPTNDETEANKQKEWIPKLCLELSSQTTIAFSSHAGNPCSDYLMPHPLWESLRAGPSDSYLNLLPMVNGGAVNFGEGFWPVLSLDLASRYLARCQSSICAGVIVMTTYLPQEEAMLSCNLWMISRMLWEKGTPHLLVESWLACYRPDFLCYQDWEHLLSEVRETSVKIGLLNAYMKDKREELTKDEYRTLTDSLLSRLRYLQVKINQQALPASESPNLKDYFTFYVRDARRLILRFLMHYQMPMVGVLDGNDMKEGFWTQVSNPNPQGLSSGVEIFVLEEPQNGEEGSAMEKIYKELI